MAPKRKRDDEPAEAATTSTTRATRRSNRNATKTNEDTAIEASNSSSASAKTRTKKVNTSRKTPPNNEDEETVPAKKKTKTTAKGKAAGKGIAKKNSRDDNLDDESEDKQSESTTTRKPNGNKATTSPSVTKPDPYTPERALTLFSKYADETEPEVIGPEGLEKLCNDGDISMEGVLPLLLAWQMDGKEMGRFSKAEWVKGTSDLKISSPQVLRQALTDLEDLLIVDKPPLKPSKNEPYNRTLYWTYAKDKKAAFHQFYTFCFTLAKSEQSRNIDIEIVAALWSVLLPPKFPIMTEVISFINEKGNYKSANKDLWIMMLEFCESVKPTLEDYDGNGGAWPTLLDDFVEAKKNQNPVP
ncbi:hypothetical protein PM082_020513 [Marasmius tenuissimus]|nr:hypothetical protein PM082_020513 [Marasmius tenuissimus]